MDSYTIKNLKQVEDAAQRFGFGSGFEARFARQALACQRTGLSYQRLAPDTEGPFGHSHRQDEEIYVVLSGSGWAKLDERVCELGQWDAIRVSPATVRAFAAGPQGLELLAFGTHTENDASMTQVDWQA